MPKTKTIKLEWCGPRGHHSPTHGEMQPGRLYDVPAEAESYYLGMSDYWQRPATAGRVTSVSNAAAAVADEVTE